MTKFNRRSVPPEHEIFNDTNVLLSPKIPEYLKDVLICARYSMSADRYYASYQWVKSGEPILQFQMPPRIFKTDVVNFHCPADCLCIHPECFNSQAIFWLPAGSNISSNANDVVYGEFYNYCMQNIDFLCKKAVKNGWNSIDKDKMVDCLNALMKEKFTTKQFDPRFLHAGDIRNSQPCLLPQVVKIVEKIEAGRVGL